MKTKYYDLHHTCYDSNGEKHTVTVVGKFVQRYIKKKITDTVPVEVKPGTFVNGEITVYKKTLHRKLTVAYSICHPTDEFDAEKGIEIAKKRIEKGEDVGSVETNDVTMLTEDLIMAELMGKLSYITSHIEDYL